MVYDEKLAERVRKSLKGKRNVTEKKMFGGIAFLSNGKMFCGVIKNDLVIRVGPEYYEKALTKPHARPMDFTGKPMRGFVYVSSDGCKTEKILFEWVNSGVDYVISLRKRSD
jgi:TfoX/Sxy family transcriptional regulator of competence genes